MIGADKYFRCANGEVLKSIDELKFEIEKNVESFNLNNFYSHVTSQKNDYANWIRHVFNEASLADNLEKCKTPEAFLEVLNNFLNSESDKTKDDMGVIKKIEAKNSKRKKFKNYFKKFFEKSVDKENSSNDSKSDDSADKETKIEESADDVSSIKQEVDDNSKKIKEAEIVDEENSSNDSKSDKAHHKLSLSERSEKLLEKTIRIKKKSYLDIEKQKETVNDLKERYEELYSLISAHRKSGKDMLIPCMKLRLIKPKIHFLEVSNNFEDRTNVRTLLDEVVDEIDESLNNEVPDLKKEILEKAAETADVNIKKNGE